MNKKTNHFGRLGAAGGLLVLLAGILQFLARQTDGFATWYARHIYPVLVGILGRFSGIFPFSVVEFGLYLLVLWLVVYMVRNISRPLRILEKTVFLAGLLFFLYTANCGINYYALPFSTYAGLELEVHTGDALAALCEELVNRVNETVTEADYRHNAAAWRHEGVRAMAGLGKSYSWMGGFYPPPKEITCSWVLSVQQLCGIYAPFTIEANFNGSMPDYNIPHTICHELSHLKGFMREDEANFIGYLACISSDNQAFRYSGYLTGWVYAGNALAGVDPERYRDLQRQLDPRAQVDLQANNVFWNQYEGRVAEAANQMNDAYLKMNDQSDGVHSYGRMVDLMLSYYQRVLPGAPD